MEEVKLTINGKSVSLTDEECDVLYKEYYKYENPFERKIDEKYYYITMSEDVSAFIDYNDRADAEYYQKCNYFRDRELAEQVALHQLLYRKLLRFGFDNNCIDIAEWNGTHDHWCIHYNCVSQNFEAYHWRAFRFLSDVYFSSKKAAERAIKEVVEPFMKEHPNFVW